MHRSLKKERGQKDMQELSRSFGNVDLRVQVIIEIRWPSEEHVKTQALFQVVYILD
jgi:hypothetical protein